MVAEPLVRAEPHLAEHPRPSAERLYIPALDGVRFLAFFLVFFHHFPPGDVFRVWSRGLSVVIQRISQFGWIGVDVFLTLSGFLIAMLLLRELSATGTVQIKRFYARRILRIWPLYYLMLVIGFFITPLFTGQAGTPAHRRFLSEHLFPFATLFGNFSFATMQASFDAMSPAADVFTPLWTIALEEQFYLVFPLMMLAAGPFVRLRTVVPYAVAGLLFSIATRYYILANQIPYPMVWMNTLAHLDPFILGILGAVIWHHHRERMLGLRLYLADVVLALGAFWLVMSFPQIGTSHHTVWQVGVVAVGAVLLIGAVLRSRYLGLAFGWRPIAWMGRISYGLYVYHILGRQVYQQVVAPSIPIGLLQGPVRWMVEFLLVLAVTTVFAAVSYYAFERHFLRFKERLAVIPSRPA